jgi:imidazolonepropionase-like amidohydrolase
MFGVFVRGRPDPAPRYYLPMTLRKICLLLAVVFACRLHGADLVFRGGRLIKGSASPAIEQGVVVVRDGKVLAAGAVGKVRIPAGARIIDTTGKTMMPGLINAHGHVGETAGLRSGPELYTEQNLLGQLGLYARYGITTVFSLGGDQTAGFDLRRRQANPEGLARARLFVAGPVIGGKTAAEARAQVDEAAAMGPDFIKIRVDDMLGSAQKMPAEAWRAVLARAHEKKLPVAAHIYYLADARALLEAGVDMIAHSVRDQEIDDATVELLKSRGVCVCPTLAREVSAFVYESRPAFFDDPFFVKEADPEVLRQLTEPARQNAMKNSRAAQQYKAALETASRNLKKLADAGVRIAFGTDSGPPARFQGYFEHMEMELMQKAGLPAAQIIRSATGDAARCMNAGGKIGVLEKGAWADVIVLEKNPLDDIRNMRSIESVWIAGNRIKGR